MLLLVLSLPALPCAAATLGLHEFVSFTPDGGWWLLEGEVARGPEGRSLHASFRLVQFDSTGLIATSRSFEPPLSAAGELASLPGAADLVEQARAELALSPPEPGPAEAARIVPGHECVPPQLVLTRGPSVRASTGPMWSHDPEGEPAVYLGPGGALAATARFSTATSFHFSQHSVTTVLPVGDCAWCRPTPADTTTECDSLPGAWGAPRAVPTTWRRVHRVAEDDVLHVRAAPTVHSTAVAALPPFARCVPVRATPGETWVWVEDLGWAHGGYLAEEAPPTLEHSCPNAPSGL